MDNSQIRAARKRAAGTKKILQNITDTKRLIGLVSKLESRITILEDKIKDMT